MKKLASRFNLKTSVILACIPIALLLVNLVPRQVVSDFSNCPGIEVIDLNLEQDTVRGFPLPYLTEEARCPMVNCLALSCDKNHLPDRKFYVQGLFANVLFVGLLYIGSRILIERLEQRK